MRCGALPDLACLQAALDAQPIGDAAVVDTAYIVLARHLTAGAAIADIAHAAAGNAAHIIGIGTFQVAGILTLAHQSQGLPAHNAAGILLVGGDDAGAAALGRYSADIKKQGYDMLYLVNAYRFLTQTAEEAIENMREIEYASRLSVTALLNSSNLAGETTAETVNSSMEFAKKAAALAELPLFAAAEKLIPCAESPESVLPCMVPVHRG